MAILSFVSTVFHQQKLKMETFAERPRGYRFGVFEVDLRAGEIRKSGLRVKLQNQPFRVLVMLLEHSPDVVLREELRKQLWNGDTFVDFDHSLSIAMNKIREALGDSAENARFIETLPRRGYRFVASVEKVLASQPPPSRTSNGAGVEIPLAPVNGGNGHSNNIALDSVLTLAKIIHEDPDPLSGEIPRDLEKVISRCLRKDIHRRFQHMDDVKNALEELKAESDFGALATESQGVAARGRLVWAGMLVSVAVVVLALGVTGWFWLSQYHPAREETQLTAVPLTTYRGYEMSPSLSPDGTQVAFQWCQEGRNCDIYVKQVGVEPAFQLTNSPAGDFSPTWSPDGRFIAFLRNVGAKRVAVILIPQRGGNERQLASWDFSKISYIPSPPHLAWTPDSTHLACPYTEGDQKKPGLLLISVDTGEKRWLTTVPVESEWDTAPAFSPDGRTLVFVRSRGNNLDLCLLRLGEGYRPQGEPERVDTGSPVNYSAVWMPDGKELVIASGTAADVTLSRMKVSDSGKPVRLRMTSENAWAPSISRTGNRLAYCVSKYDSNIWRVDLGGPGRAAGSPVQLIFSTKPESGPAYSPDGKRIAYESKQTGGPEVWICDSEGRNPVQLTSFGFWGDTRSEMVTRWPKHCLFWSSRR